MTTLIINITDLETQEEGNVILKASNTFMLAIKYAHFLTCYAHVNSYTLLTREGQSGSNHPINSGAYLCEAMEELTGINLA